MTRLLLAAFLLPAVALALLPGLTIYGDPGSDSGAYWTYRDTVNDTVFDQAGMLYKPAGVDTYPGVIISHGMGGSAFVYGAQMGREMRPWGLVCIATHYTHAGGVPPGSPGDSTMPGASRANVQRAMTCWRVLASLEYVDTARIAAHGNSAGAFVTGGLTGTHPDVFKVASHTAGGVNDDREPWTKSWQAESISCPYQMHHGDLDTHVPLDDDERMDSILGANRVKHELVVYAGRGHDIGRDTMMLRLVREWYTEHGLFDTSTVAIEEKAEGRWMKDERRMPTVAGASDLARFKGRVFDMTGRHVTDKKRAQASGIYFVQPLAVGRESPVRKVVIPD